MNNQLTPEQAKSLIEYWNSLSTHTPPPKLPENTEELLNDLHQEFYSGPKAHADAFRILPKVIENLKYHNLI